MIGIGQQINIWNISSKRSCHDAAPSQFGDHEAFANLSY